MSRAFSRSWRCHPKLEFSEEALGLNGNQYGKIEKARDFTSKVDYILEKHSGIGLKVLKLQIASVYDVKDCCHLDSWLQIAVKPGIEELNLCLPRLKAKYNFPCSLLSNGTGDSLRYLLLSGCNFHPTVELGCLISLTRLQLCMVNITGYEIECLLSNSFALEQLELKHCSDIICLKIPCLQWLSHLEVLDCIRLKVIESKAPNLSSFRFAGRRGVQLLLGETLRVKRLERICSNGAFYARTELPSSMPNLETLAIYSEIEKVNTPMVPSRFHHLKFLSISLCGQSYDYFSLVSFFDASPSLESFFLNVFPGRFPGRMGHVSIFEDSLDLRKMPEHSYNRLKSVNIVNFSSAKSLVELTCHILESTRSLECLTLDTTDGVTRCSSNKSGKCFLMRKDTLVEAHRALLAVQTYIVPKVPSTIKLNVLEPCRRCHVVED